MSQVNVDLAGNLGDNAGDNQLDTVEINGTNGSDVITLSMRADGALVVSGLAEEVVIEHFDPTDAIHINGLGGDDVINASALGVGGPLLTLSGDEGADVLTGSAGNDTILGGAGDDVLIGGPGLDVLDGGPGNNILIQSLTMGGPNATLSLYGSDDANSIESIDISANGQGLLLSRDMVNMTMDSNDVTHLNNVGRIYFAALDGQENIHVHDLSGTDVKQLGIDLGRREIRMRVAAMVSRTTSRSMGRLALIRSR